MNIATPWEMRVCSEFNRCAIDRRRTGAVCHAQI
jgi:hypothetical protein